MNHGIRALLIFMFVIFSLPVRADLFSQVIPFDDPGLTADDQFGISGVNLSTDGLSVVAATPFITFPPGFNDGQGSGYMYQFANNQWTPTAQFISTLDQTMYGIGFAFSRDGSTALFGDLPDSMGTFPGEADFYQILNGNATEVQAQFDPTTVVGTGFGSVIALSANGDVAVIGAPYDSQNNGAAYVYTYDGGSDQWVQSAALTDPNDTTLNSFGAAVAVSGDGSSVLIGTYANGGTVFEYSVVSNSWTKIREFDNVVVCQGCMALSSDGQSIVIATDSGVTVYTASDNPPWSGTPIAITDPSGPVDMSADGDAVVIGTYDRIVYLYELASGTWAQTKEFDDPSSDTNDGFGSVGFGPSVALSDDKETVAVSAGTATYNLLSMAGTVYVFQSSADLSLSMTAIPSLVALNQQVKLDTTISNHDTEVIAYNVTLTDTMPAGLTYVGSNPAGGSCSATGAVVTCKLTSLAPGAVWQPSLTVQVSTAGAYTDSASVGSNQPDTDTSNNSGSASISMLPPTVSSGSVTTNQGMAVNGTLNGSNPCNCGVPVFSVVTQPSHGSVSITNSATGAFTYTPAAGYSGSDSFTFHLANGFDISGTATESVTANSSTGGSSSSGGSSLDLFALGLMGVLLAIIQRRKTRR